jgi:hypothetical protein
MHISKDVTTAGTPVRLVANTVTTPTSRYCARVTIFAKAANTGFIYVTYSPTEPAAGVGIRLDAEQSYTIGMGETRGNGVDLAHVWLDSSVNAEGVFAEVEQI